MLSLRTLLRGRGDRFKGCRQRGLTTRCAEPDPLRKFRASRCLSLAPAGCCTHGCKWWPLGSGSRERGPRRRGSARLTTADCSRPVPGLGSSVASIHDAACQVAETARLTRRVIHLPPIAAPSPPVPASRFGRTLSSHHPHTMASTPVLHAGGFNSTTEQHAGDPSYFGNHRSCICPRDFGLSRRQHSNVPCACGGITYSRAVLMPTCGVDVTGLR